MSGLPAGHSPRVTSPGGGPANGAFRTVRSPALASERRLARLFMLPSVLTMGLVALFPVLYAVGLSFFAYDGRRRKGFAGLANYATALTSGDFWHPINATFVFTIASVTFGFLIGLGFALIMHQAFAGRGVTRAMILVPWVIPTVISAQMWSLMFHVTPGFINHYVPFVPEDFNWLGTPNWAMVSIVVADVWKTAPFVALLLLAGLQTIPQDIYESAHIDGANSWQRFIRITLPLLEPAILVALLFRTVDSLRVYDLPKVMTGGAFGTETLSIMVQRFVADTPNPGMGSTLSTLGFAVVLGVGVIFVSLLGRDLVVGRQR
ncbi:MAG: carbohydrate ABC transporter permease [Egibacteraceae bacterium]